MPISAGLREDIAVYRGFIGQQYFSINRFDHKDLRTAYYEVIVYGNSCTQKIFYYLDGTTGDLLFKTSRIFGDEGMKGQELPFDEYLRKKERK